MTDAEKKPCCAAEPAEKDTALSCCRHKDRTPEEYRALANRLSRIEGQVRGIHAMLDKDVYCADILVQVAAVNAALNGFSKELLSQHVRTCVADDLRAGGTQKLDELLQLLPLRKRMSVQCLQLLGVAVKAAACLGEGDLPGAAVKQLEPQLMLQLPDLLGQGRLGDVEGVCRSSKALLFSNG